MNINHLKFLTPEEMKDRAPAIFSPKAAPTVSRSYQFIPTPLVTAALEKEGWHPTQVSQVGYRTPFKKHMVRFQHEDQIIKANKKEVGDLIPELVMINSHNASSCFTFMGGVFRLVCSNGMIVADSTIQSVKVRHLGFEMSQIIEAAMSISRSLPQLAEEIRKLRSISLTDKDRNYYAYRAAQLRWGKDLPLKVELILAARRVEDQSNDLWTTFNVLQEHLLRGGHKATSSSGRHIETKAIRQLDRNLKLNKDLWQLTKWFAAKKEKGRMRSS